uniref:Ig-like domain-containing protein n=1 Tax=Macaca fascicularis TaxID=9541 RepID=A0A7N9CBI5_MACFA
MDLLCKNMKHLWFFLLLVAAPRWVLSQVQLQESGPGVVKPSETLSLTLRCSLVAPSAVVTTGAGSASPRKGLEWIGVSIVIVRVPTPPSRVESPFQRHVQEPVLLKLSSVTATDTAVYYCARDTVRGGGCEPRHKPPAGRRRGGRRCRSGPAGARGPQSRRPGQEQVQGGRGFLICSVLSLLTSTSAVPRAPLSLISVVLLPHILLPEKKGGRHIFLLQLRFHRLLGTFLQVPAWPIIP